MSRCFPGLDVQKDQSVIILKAQGIQDELLQNSMTLEVDISTVLFRNVGEH